MAEVRKSNASMPLKYWFLILAVISGLLLLFYHFNTDVLRKQDVLFSNSLPKEWRQLNPDKKQVVILGSSLFRFSFPLNERKLTDEVELLMFFKRGGKIFGFDQFIANGMPVKPELLIIQTDMLADGRTAASHFRRETQVTLNRFWLGIKGVKLNSLSEKLEGRVIKREVLTNCEEVAPRNEWQVRNLRKLYGNSVAPFRGVKSRLRRLQDEGIKIALLTIPRSPAVEAKIETELSNWSEYIADLAEELDIPLIVYPLNFEDSGFCDGAHMNKDSRKKHAAWLRGQIKELLDDAS